jgi:hypothetical protein
MISAMAVPSFMASLSQGQAGWSGDWGERIRKWREGKARVARVAVGQVCSRNPAAAASSGKPHSRSRSRISPPAPSELQFCQHSAALPMAAEASYLQFWQIRSFRFNASSS